MQYLSEIIKYHRKRAGLSREDLASLAGTGKTVIFDIEHGKQTVQLNTLFKITGALNITISFNSPLMEEYMNKSL